MCTVRFQAKCFLPLPFFKWGGLATPEGETNPMQLNYGTGIEDFDDEYSQTHDELGMHEERSDSYVDYLEDPEPESVQQYRQMLEYLSDDDPMTELLETRIEDFLTGW